MAVSAKGVAVDHAGHFRTDASPAGCAKRTSAQTNRAHVTTAHRARSAKSDQMHQPVAGQGSRSGARRVTRQDALAKPDRSRQFARASMVPSSACGCPVTATRESSQSPRHPFGVLSCHDRAVAGPDSDGTVRVAGACHDWTTAVAVPRLGTLRGAGHVTDRWGGGMCADSTRRVPRSSTMDWTPTPNVSGGSPPGVQPRQAGPVGSRVAVLAGGVAPWMMRWASTSSTSARARPCCASSLR